MAKHDQIRTSVEKLSVHQVICTYLQPPPQKPPAPSMPASAPPMKPTFPAYSSPAASSSTPPMTPSATHTISAAPTIKKPESSSGLTIKLVHPDEDISLVCVCCSFSLVGESESTGRLVAFRIFSLHIVKLYL